MHTRKYTGRYIHLLFIFTLCLTAVGQAQPALQPVQVSVVPDHGGWQREPGVPVRFRIAVTRHGMPVRNLMIRWQAGPERMTPMGADSAMSADGQLLTPAFRMDKPGFLRCVATVGVDGSVYRGLATVGYAADSLRSTVPMPEDFNVFWDGVKRELARIPTDARLTPMPERSTGRTEVFQVSLQNIGNSRLYGILCVPRKPGRYPAILQVPGAGIRPYQPDVELMDKDLIVFTIGIHGIPVNLEPSVYRDLENGALKGHFFFNNDHRDRFYYKRVYAGCVRAVDFIFGLASFDGGNLGVSGNSQGGALSIVTASLDPRVKCIGVIHPALCDLTGYFHGRAGGWPHVFSPASAWYSDQPEVRQAMAYYDVVNFARQLKQPGWYTWGFNDESCPPTSMHAAFNVIMSKKELALWPETGHWFYPEQRARMNAWLLEKLK